MNYPCLRMFVNETDYKKLIKLLLRIHDNTLKNRVSILSLVGGYSSGKSTLMKIIERLSPSFSRANSNVFDRYSRPKTTNMRDFNNDLVLLSEKVGYGRKNLSSFHMICNQPIKIIGSHKYVIKSGVIVFGDSKSPIITVLEKDKKKPIELKLPNRFIEDDMDLITIQGIYHIGNPYNDQVTKACVEEFHQIKKAIDTNILCEALWNYVSNNTIFGELPYEMYLHVLNFLITEIE